MRWPVCGEALWKAFVGLGRQYGMAGPLPISMQEIDAWQRVHGVKFTSWELDMIREFDAITLQAAMRDKD